MKKDILSPRYWRRQDYLEIKRALSLNPYSFEVQKRTSIKLVNVCFICRKKKKTNTTVWFRYDDPEQEPDYSKGITSFFDVCNDPNCITYAHFITKA